MRFFWSVVLAGGLLLVGLDAYESGWNGPDAGTQPAVAMAEDGTGYPPPPPPPPPR